MQLLLSESRTKGKGYVNKGMIKKNISGVAVCIAELQFHLNMHLYFYFFFTLDENTKGNFPILLLQASVLQCHCGNVNDIYQPPFIECLY
jgi:hypothetical protein